MELIELNKRPDIEINSKLDRRYQQFEKLLSEIFKHEIPDEITGLINEYVHNINSIVDSENELRKLLRKSQSKILKLIEKELNLVTKNHYRNAWLAIGLSIGIAIGSAIGTKIGGMSLLGIGMTVGMALGIVWGNSMDKKAKESGLQLDIEIRH
ncbi:MAG: hypothetical protein PHS59_07540 [Paludibacter sp.]|nr:hypothetical protein [Paludibacter sp.]